MTSTVLVTGGAGFIGSALGRRLADLGHDVWALDNMHPRVHHDARTALRALDPRISLRVVDLADAAALTAALAAMPAFDVVVHLAADTATGLSLSHTGDNAATNVLGTANLLDALARGGRLPAQLVVCSSRAVYGEGVWMYDDDRPYPARPRTPQALRAGEWEPGTANAMLRPVMPVAHRATTTPARPTNIYAASKLAQENFVSIWAAGHGVAAAVLRLQNVYGPGQSLTNPYTGVLVNFVTQALAGRALEVYEGGGIVRDFVHVNDVVAALERCLALGPRDVLVDVGSGEATTLWQIARTVAELAGAPAPVPTNAFRLGDVRAASATLDEARSVLGYEPSVPLADGLRDLVAFVAAGEASP